MENVTINDKISGFINIWRVCKKTGEKTLLVAKKNLVLYQGADLLASALAGVKYANVSHMYIGFVNDNGFAYPGDAPTIDKTYSTPFSAYGLDEGEDLVNFGYLRLPLAYTPTFLTQTNYDNNTVIFTTVIATTEGSAGALFKDSQEDPPSRIFEVALAAALNPNTVNEDKIFSRANFEPITYDSNYNFTIAWGIRFLA